MGTTTTQTPKTDHTTMLRGFLRGAGQSDSMLTLYTWVDGDGGGLRYKGAAKRNLFHPEITAVSRMRLALAPQG
jgi:hypothetical protein